MPIDHYINDSCTPEWLRISRTIEGDVEPDSHDSVSNLKPRPILLPESFSEKTEEA